MTPEERKRRQAEYARKKYRRLKGLPEDAVLRLSPEEYRQREKERKRAYAQNNADAIRKKRGRVKWAEHVARRKEAAEAGRLAKEAGKRASDARKAAERQARKEAERWEMRPKKSLCDSTAKGMSTSSPIRKRGRILALAGWLGW